MELDLADGGVGFEVREHVSQQNARHGACVLVASCLSVHSPLPSPLCAGQRVKGRDGNGSPRDKLLGRGRRATHPLT